MSAMQGGSLCSKAGCTKLHGLGHRALALFQQGEQASSLLVEVRLCSRAGWSIMETGPALGKHRVLALLSWQVRDSAPVAKRSFLEGKGLTAAEIQEAFRRVPGSLQEPAGV